MDLNPGRRGERPIRIRGPLPRNRAIREPTEIEIPPPRVKLPAPRQTREELLSQFLLCRYGPATTQTGSAWRRRIRLRKSGMPIESHRTRCDICQEDYQAPAERLYPVPVGTPMDDPAVLKVLACRHMFHRICLDGWLSSHDTCPACRQDVFRTLNGGYPEDITTALVPFSDNESLVVEDEPPEDFSYDLEDLAFPFNEEMDLVWENCTQFTRSDTRDNNIHPLHLALVLLFDKLPSADDPRLYDDVSFRRVDPTSPATRLGVLERPLFWIAVSEASGARERRSLFEFMEEVERTDDDNEGPIQNIIGIELWEMITGLNASDLAVPDEDVRTQLRNSIFDGCSQAMLYVLLKARQMSRDKGDSHIAPHHVLLAILQSKIRLPELVHRWKPEIVKAIHRLRKRKVSRHGALERFAFLKKFATDRTEMLRDTIRKKEPVERITGRNQEMREIISILSRRSKSSAVLLSDPGVGKTAIADALALRIVQGQVPESVIARVFTLDLSELLASTACKKAYETILQTILDEVAEHEEMGIRAIIFFDDLSQITLGGYRDDGSGIDAAALMKPYLTSGQLRCVGCATFDDYRNSIEKDNALSRQFSPVYVGEPSVDQTVDILRGMKESMQAFHKVHIHDEAFIDSAYIAFRYLTHRRLPDSAVELLDEACTNAKISVDSRWEQVGKLKRRKVMLELDIESLERELEPGNDSEIERKKQQVRRINHDFELYRSALEQTKPIKANIATLDHNIEEKQKEINEYSRHGFRAEKYAAMRDLDILRSKRLEAQVELDTENAESNGRDLTGDTGYNLTASSNGGAPGPVITKHHVREAASWYRPMDFKDCAVKSKEVKDVAQVLSQRVVGQGEAIASISSAVRCVLTGLTDTSRPVASFVLGGPAGAGKTLLAKELARVLLGSSNKLVQINGADYSEAHSVSRLIGTPVCTGFDQGGELTECIRRKPFSVILIQDIDRASSQFRLHIQTVLDEGSLRDGDGKLVDFTKTVIVMTTSLGQTKSLASYDRVEEKKHYLEAIHKVFPVEFLARIDDLVIFNQLREESMPVIVGIRMKEIAAQLDRVKITLHVEDEAQTYLEKVGWSSKNASSQLEPILREQILRPISELILDNRLHDGWTVTLELDDLGRGLNVIPSPTPPVAGQAIISRSSSDLDVDQEPYDVGNEPEAITSIIPSNIFASLAAQRADFYVNVAQPVHQFQPQGVF